MTRIPEDYIGPREVALGTEVVMCDLYRAGRGYQAQLGDKSFVSVRFDRKIGWYAPKFEASQAATR